MTRPAGDGAIAAQGDEQPALGTGVAAAPLQAIYRADGRAGRVRIVGNLLVYVLEQGLGLVAGFFLARRQPPGQGRDRRCVAFQARLALDLLAGTRRSIQVGG